MVNSGNWNNNLSRIHVIDNSQNLTPTKEIIYNSSRQSGQSSLSSILINSEKAPQF